MVDLSKLEVGDVIPDMIHRKRGGWLAISPLGHSLRIGVVAETEERARVKFDRSLSDWVTNLENRKSANNGVGTSTENHVPKPFDWSDVTPGMAFRCTWDETILYVLAEDPLNSEKVIVLRYNTERKQYDYASFAYKGHLTRTPEHDIELKNGNEK